MERSPPGYPVHGTSQARTQGWVTISFSRESSRPRDQTRVSRIAGGFVTTEPPLLFCRSIMSNSLPLVSGLMSPLVLRGLQHARPPCPSPSPGVCSNWCSLSRWCHPTISSSVGPFSFCPQSFPASGSFLMSHFFVSDGQSIGASASASVLPMNIQGWFSLWLTGLISLLSKGLSTVFSNTTVQKHQFFGTQLSLWSNSHLQTWLLKKP